LNTLDYIIQSWIFKDICDSCKINPFKGQGMNSPHCGTNTSNVFLLANYVKDCLFLDTMWKYTLTVCKSRTARWDLCNYKAAAKSKKDSI